MPFVVGMVAAVPVEGSAAAWGGEAVPGSGDGPWVEEM